MAKPGTRSQTAFILFTLAPEDEAARKPLGSLDVPREAQIRIFASLIEHVAALCASLRGVDLLVASPNGNTALRQRGRDFGESLRFAFEDAFALGYERVVVIGNDAPEMTERYFAGAVAALSEGGCRAVLGPAADGGYNLLGLTESCPDVFTEMAWGSSSVCGVTHARLARAGFDVTLLPVVSDIDSRPALERFVRRAIASGCLDAVRLGEQLRRLVSLAPPARLPLPTSTFVPVWTPSGFATRRGPPTRLTSRSP